MLAVNYSNLRDNLKNYCDKVSDDFETEIITLNNVDETQAKLKRESIS